MRRQTITFRLDADKKKALDTIAAGLDRDRSYVINEAVRSYVEIYQWQVGHIREGLRQADAGVFASDSKVAEILCKMAKDQG